MTLVAPVPGLEPAFTVDARLGPLEDHGMTRAGHRRVVPIAGGRVVAVDILDEKLDQLLAQLKIEPEGATPQAEIEPLVAMGEQVLADGKANFVGMARPLIVDPEWLNKAAAGAPVSRHTDNILSVSIYLMAQMREPRAYRPLYPE